MKYPSSYLQSEIFFITKLRAILFCNKCNFWYLFQLKPQEAEFLAVNTNAALSSFEKVSENMGKVAIH